LDTGLPEEETVDLLVLSAGLVPAEGNPRLAKTLGIELDDLGFFKEPDPVRKPLASGAEGIYLCGGATGPIDISESVVQASAAAMMAVTRS
jgi:heterodisulfide reductase subunit A